MPSAEHGGLKNGYGKRNMHIKFVKVKARLRNTVDWTFKNCDFEVLIYYVLLKLGISYQVLL